MTFRKARLPIAYKDDGELAVRFVDGYIFEACFSTGQLFEVGVYFALEIHMWIVTDINTGYSLNAGKTRKKAVQVFQSHYCNKLERMVLSNEHWSSVPSCHENVYEHMSAEFANAIKQVRNGE